MKRLFIIAAFLLAACTRADQTPAPAVPQRIISVVPSATEMLFAMGAGNRVVAVGDYELFPPEVASLPRVGGLINPDVEKIIQMKPDMVVTYGSQEVLQQRLGQLGIRLYPFSHGNIDQTLNFMLELGNAIGAGPRSQEVAAAIRSTFAELRRTAPATRPTVLLVHSRRVGVLGSFYSVGNKAFQHELIEIAGGRNVLGDLDQEVVQPSIEEVIHRGPDIVVETIPQPANAEEIRQRVRDWDALKTLPAVTHHRVYVVAENYMLVPGPRLDLAAKKFAELIRQP